MGIHKFPNKEFKIIVLKDLRELQETQINNLTKLGTKYKNKSEVQQRENMKNHQSFRTEEYNDWAKKCNREFQ